ncbi:MAG: hypothetical protein KC635_25520 [Myxococcales bacterium]|nr:hypothetical protein [Myxococcales bacterium]
MRARALAFAALAVAACSVDIATPPIDKPARVERGAMTPDCFVAALLERNLFFVGAGRDEPGVAPADVSARSLYFYGALPGATCASCADPACVAGGVHCDGSDGVACPWWACWQDPTLPPGRHVQTFLDEAGDDHDVAFVSYDMWSSVIASEDHERMLTALREPYYIARWGEDLRFFLRLAAKRPNRRVILHLEPRLWGIAQQTTYAPERIYFDTRAIDGNECDNVQQNLAGLLECVVLIARKDAPNVVIGLPVVPWGYEEDAFTTTREGFDVDEHVAQSLGWLAKLGAGAQPDLLVVELAHGDAGATGEALWEESGLDAPSFERTMRWVRAVGGALHQSVVLWRAPFGHMQLDDTCGRYRDNREDWLFDHVPTLREDGVVGVVFEAAGECMTRPLTDDGHFVARSRAFLAGEPPLLCDPAALAP